MSTHWYRVLHQNFRNKEWGTRGRKPVKKKKVGGFFGRTKAISDRKERKKEIRTTFRGGRGGGKSKFTRVERVGYFWELGVEEKKAH